MSVKSIIIHNGIVVQVSLVSKQQEAVKDFLILAYGKQKCLYSKEAQ